MTCGTFVCGLFISHQCLCSFYILAVISIGGACVAVSYASAVYPSTGFVNNMAALEPVPQPTGTHML